MYFVGRKKACVELGKCWAIGTIIITQHHQHHPAHFVQISLHCTQCTVVCNLVRTGVHWNVGLQQLRCWQITKGRMQLCVRVRASILPTKSQPVKISLKLYLIRVILGLPNNFSFSELLLLQPVFSAVKSWASCVPAPPPMGRHWQIEYRCRSAIG